MNIFKNMNRKQKREYDKLDNDKKEELLQAAIVDKVSGTMATEIAKAMITGMELEREQLYQKYVTKIDDCSYGCDEWLEYVDKLLSYLRVEHLKYEQKKMKNMQEGEKNEV